MAGLRICNKCGRAHVPLSRAAVEAQAREFGAYIAPQTPETQALFGLGPLARTPKEWNFAEHVAQAEHCFRCGNDYENFHDQTAADSVPAGCTLQGIVYDPPAISA